MMHTYGSFSKEDTHWRMLHYFQVNVLMRYIVGSSLLKSDVPRPKENYNAPGTTYPKSFGRASFFVPLYPLLINHGSRASRPESRRCHWFLLGSWASHCSFVRCRRRTLGYLLRSHPSRTTWYWRWSGCEHPRFHLPAAWRWPSKVRKNWRGHRKRGGTLRCWSSQTWW